MTSSSSARRRTIDVARLQRRPGRRQVGVVRPVQHYVIASRIIRMMNASARAASSGYTVRAASSASRRRARSPLACIGDGGHRAGVNVSACRLEGTVRCWRRVGGGGR
jgi:hypothetical protein